ncbi:MAG TPA: bile acid:sodium symporter family protein [Aquabacterium sp.]|uniref:bile acid:sodium symporter family protein n=1 Tax=Aquabacterium sp. TaxID=1872578 RepID=UPI002D86611F|nr:bile acid:sodium symporter family protein [Aquabacterium sp.]HET6786732.1 bile acid:sodium symporter family protein [Aquabacterium sp.]HEX5371252.1 bile acid:sodium symporter family protein [Aquabacterium sp.]
MDWFLMGMIGAVALASLAPDIGRSGGWLHLDAVTDIGVFALFFLHGMGLSTANLRDGASKWRLHLLVQLCTYVAFPLWWALLARLAGGHVSQDLLMGFFYLAVLPSTVSSSVAMTALARGHVAAAVLNATLSTLLGVFLTPLLVSLVMSGAGHSFDVGQTMLKVAQMLLLPFVAGHLLRPWLASWFARIKPVTTVFDRAVIVLLVWSAFSDSVADGLWTRHGWGLLAQAAVGAVLFLVPMLWFTRALARWMRFPVEDEIVAVFCGSKKTLASGMPMAKLLFGGSAAMGVLVLPIMLYHQIQLFVCAVMARRYATRKT